MTESQIAAAAAQWLIAWHAGDERSIPAFPGADVPIDFRELHSNPTADQVGSFITDNILAAAAAIEKQAAMALGYVCSVLLDLAREHEELDPSFDFGDFARRHIQPQLNVAAEPSSAG